MDRHSLLTSILWMHLLNSLCECTRCEADLNRRHCIIWKLLKLKSCLKLVSCNMTEKFRFSAEFIEMRRQALDVFINRIASHHELQQSEDLRKFLLEDEQVGYPFSVAWFICCTHFNRNKLFDHITYNIWWSKLWSGKVKAICVLVIVEYQCARSGKLCVWWN